MDKRELETRERIAQLLLELNQDRLDPERLLKLFLEIDAAILLHDEGDATLHSSVDPYLITELETLCERTLKIAAITLPPAAKALEEFQARDTQRVAVVLKALVAAPGHSIGDSMLPDEQTVFRKPKPRD